MGISDEDFDSGDALFDDIDEDDLIFDALEEAGVMNPTKKHSRGKENDVQDLAPAKKARRGSFSLTENSSKGRLGETQRIQLARKLLADKFGYKEFRHEQEAAITRLLDGENALVVFPTGAGKSLCYQVCPNSSLNPTPSAVRMY
jgi:superfamily II DNA helicase RecQ